MYLNSEGGDFTEYGHKVSYSGNTVQRGTKRVHVQYDADSYENQDWKEPNDKVEDVKTKIQD